MTIVIGRQKNFFISRTVNEEGENFNPYKNLKKDKAKFIEYKNTLNEVISLLSTINQARIYMEGTTFKKVEDHLQLQASMQLARIPKIHSSWILPYISEKVLQVSKNNYQEAGLLDFDKLQELYAKTGRNVKNAQSIDELIFSKAEYSFDFKAQKEFNKEEEKVNISSAEQDIIRQRELYKRLMKEAAKQKELTDKEKNRGKSRSKNRSNSFNG